MVEILEDSAWRLMTIRWNFGKACLGLGLSVVGRLIRKRFKRAIIVSQRTRHVARLVQIAFDFAQAKLSAGKRRPPQDDKDVLDVMGDVVGDRA